MKRFVMLLLLPLTLVFAQLSYAADEYAETMKEFKAAKATAPFFKNAYGYAVFPTIGKGGLGIGFAHGDGKVYKAGKLTGNTSMSQVSVGLQAGGQAYSQIIFFQNKKSYTEFVSENFEFSAEAQAVALNAGAQARAGSTGSSAGSSGSGDAGKQAKTDYYKGMVAFTFAKGGLMYAATLGGQKFSFEPAGK